RYQSAKRPETTQLPNPGRGICGTSRLIKSAISGYADQNKEKSGEGKEIPRHLRYLLVMQRSS
ncbi:MAG: hypothetical protein KDI06_04160, partial [Calditrichaeota bacterium]|nr:hypothetical protein [Calditrichota bacterium]